MSLRQRLRSETSESHVALETSLDLMSPRMTASDYRAVLEVFRRVQDGLETWLEKQTERLPAKFYLDDRRKLPMVEADLGGEAVSGRASPEPSAPADFSWANTDAKLWGVLYVIEGSTLGGQILGPRFDTFKSEGLGASYFRSYGPAVGRMWQGFIKRLDTIAIEDWDETVLAASRTFEQIAKMFEERSA